MPRYMEQGLFNNLVLLVCMTELEGSEASYARLNQTLSNYIGSYPGENGDHLIDDLDAAAAEMKGVQGELYKGLSLHAGETGERFSILVEVSHILIASERKGRPLWRRIFGGTWFNYSAQPIPNRASVAIRDISAACGVLLLRALRTFDQSPLTDTSLISAELDRRMEMLRRGST